MRTTAEPWLPHRPPFRFVDHIVDVTDHGGDFILDLAHEDERLHDGVLPPLLLVEALAQSAAAYSGYRNQDQAEEGMLVELQHVELAGTAAGGDCVELHIEPQHQLGALVRFTGTASVRGTVLAQATFTVARGAAATR